MERWAGISFLLALIGGLTVFKVWPRWKVNSRVSQEPERITLKKLIERGRSGNPYVQIVEYRVGKLQVRSAEPGNMVSGTAFLPLVAGVPGSPFQPSEVPPGSIHAVLKAEVALGRSEDFLDGPNPAITGMVINAFEPLSSRSKELLVRGYPGNDFDNVLIVEQGRQPTESETDPILLVAGAVFMAQLPFSLLALYWLNKRRKRNSAGPLAADPADYESEGNDGDGAEKS